MKNLGKVINTIDNGLKPHTKKSKKRSNKRRHSSFNRDKKLKEFQKFDIDKAILKIKSIEEELEQIKYNLEKSHSICH